MLCRILYVILSREMSGDGLQIDTSGDLDAVVRSAMTGLCATTNADQTCISEDMVRCFFHCVLGGSHSKLMCHNCSHPSVEFELRKVLKMLASVFCHEIWAEAFGCIAD